MPRFFRGFRFGFVAETTAFIVNTIGCRLNVFFPEKSDMCHRVIGCKLNAKVCPDYTWDSRLLGNVQGESVFSVMAVG